MNFLNQQVNLQINNVFLHILLQMNKKNLILFILNYRYFKYKIIIFLLIC